MSIIDINGIDESGRIGEDIIFAKVSVERDFELHLLLKNLSCFRKLIPNKNDVNGYDTASLVRYARDIIESEMFKTSIYKMRCNTQVLLLRLLYTFMSEDLFALRGDVIELFNKKDWGVIQTVLSSLNRFKRKTIFAESFVKAFGMKQIVQDIGKFYLEKYGTVENLSNATGPRIIVQIDGGFPFVFWWKRLLDNVESGLVKGKCLISGITNGDSYYPTMATAGAISNALRIHPELHYRFPIKELDPQRIKSENEDFLNFYKSHSYSLTRPVYQNRILFIGKIQDKVICCIPYLFHIQERRTKTFETFLVSGDIENFLRDFGHGTKEDTNIVVGKMASPLDRQNLQYCQSKEYPIKHLSDFKTSYNDLSGKLHDEIELSPSPKRRGLENKLSSLDSTCKQELE